MANDSYHAEVVYNIKFVNTRLFSSWQLFNNCGRVIHSVSNSLGPWLRVWAWMETELLPNW